MEYYELKIKAAEESREAVLALLARLGLTGFGSEGDLIVTYAGSKAEAGRIGAELEQFQTTLKEAGLAPEISCDSSPLPEQDWNEVWKKNFSPIDVGRNLTIIPSWLEHATDRIPLIIDPGMVFGTGHHESTRSSLVLIERLSDAGSKKSFLDIGTGSGVLAIAASRLGFQELLAIDIDPLAVDAAQRNVIANSLGNILVREATLSDISGRFDMIAANLLSEILISIASDLATHLEPNGVAVLSGILLGQEDDVKKAMQKAGLRLMEELVDGTWVSLVVGHSKAVLSFKF